MSESLRDDDPRTWIGEPIEPCDCDSPRGKIIRAMADFNGDQGILLPSALNAMYGDLADEVMKRLTEGNY